MEYIDLDITQTSSTGNEIRKLDDVLSGSGLQTLPKHATNDALLLSVRLQEFNVNNDRILLCVRG